MRILFLIVACLLLAGCGMLSPDQQSTALDVIEQMLAQGTITPEQYEGLRQSILAGGTGAWWQQIAEVAVAAGLAYVGVRLQRGPPTRTENVAKKAAKQIAAAG